MAHGFPLYRENTFTKDYRCRKLSLVLVFRAICVDKVRSIDDRDGLPVYCLVIRARLPNMRCLYLRDEQPVLVSKVELMERVEKVANGVSSPVRLYRVQEFPAESDDGRVLFSGRDEGFKMFPRWIYREPNSIVGGGSVSAGELIPRKIKRRSKIVDGISAEDSEALYDFFISKIFPRLFSIFRINHGAYVWCELGAENLRGVRVEFKHVLSSPFDL